MRTRTLSSSRAPSPPGFDRRRRAEAEHVVPQLEPALVNGAAAAGIQRPVARYAGCQSLSKEFLHEQLLPTYVRSVHGKSAKGCIEWYFHPEAVSRIAVLWRSWEHLRLDPSTGMSVWWRIMETTTCASSWSQEDPGGVVPRRAHSACLTDKPEFGGLRLSYFGPIRIAPSRRMVSPLSIGLLMMWATRAAYSEALPSLEGCGTC